jgi:hypothetical protein
VFFRYVKRDSAVAVRSVDTSIAGRVALLR